MNKRSVISASALLYGGSLVLHVGLAVGLSLLPKQKKSEVVAITMAEGKKKGKGDDEKPEPPKPLPEPPKQAAAKAAPAPKAAPKPVEQTPQQAAPPPAAGMENLLDLGMMGNGGSGNGMAIGPRGPATPAPTTTATATKKTEALAPVADKCADPTLKPRRKGGPQPAYTQQARQAEIEGQVRVQVTVDETGHVVAATVLGGLGYGLDEAALAAAKRWRFDPATKCGNPVVGTAVLPFGFHLDK